MDKLRPGDFKFCEKLLYEQKHHETSLIELEAELTELLEDLLPGSSGSYVDMTASRDSESSSQPEAWSIRREENLRVQDLRREIARRKRHRAAVTEAMSYMDDAESALIHLRYYAEKPHSYCSRQLSMWDPKAREPVATYWRMRRRILHKMARFLGLIAE